MMATPAESRTTAAADRPSFEEQAAVRPRSRRTAPFSLDTLELSSMAGWTLVEA
jgi:hypothetical protein